MSRSNGSSGPAGTRAPQRRHPADDPYAAPATGQSGHWPGPAGYPDQAAPQAPQQGQGYHFPPGPETEPNYGYAQPPSGSLPFERYQPPQAAPAYAPQQGQHPQAAPGQWNPPHDTRGYDLNNYMPPGSQGYAQPESGQFQQLHEQQPQYAAQQGYGENDADYDDAFADGEEEPRRSRRGLLIISALVGAIGLGGAVAYTYKTFIANGSGARAPLVRAGDPSLAKIKPVNPGGKEIAYTDRKVLDTRLGDDAGQQRGAAEPGAQDDRGSDEPGGPRKVRIIPITPGGGQAAAQPPGPQQQVMPGIMLDNVGPPRLPPSARAQQAQPAMPPPVRVAQQPPVRVAPPPPMAPAAAPTEVAALPVRKAAPVAPKVAVPREPSVPASTATSNGFVAVLSSQKSRMDALKAFADLQQKYGDVLGAKTPDVLEANLGDKGTWYRAVVGPPGSRDAASGICTQLKTAGYVGCWVTTY